MLKTMLKLETLIEDCRHNCSEGAISGFPLDDAVCGDHGLHSLLVEASQEDDEVTS